MKATIKGLLKSKTFWLNTITVALAIVNEVNGTLIPTKYAVEAIAILNIGLRLLTNKSLSQK